MSPISAGLVVSMVSRSANSFGNATVTALNVVELATIVTTSATTTRHIMSLDTRADAPDGLLAARTSWRTRVMNVTPTPMVTTPGSANAHRQPRYCAITPVMTAEDATPRLPHTPLMPTWRPSLSAW